MNLTVSSSIEINCLLDLPKLKVLVEELKLKINKFGCVIGSPVDSEYKNKNNGKCYDQNLAPGILSGDNFTDTYFLLF